MTPSNPDLLTTDEAAAYLCKSPRTLEAWRLESPPRGPDFIRIEGNVRYARESLIDYLADRMNKAILPRARAAETATLLRGKTLPTAAHTSLTDTNNWWELTPNPKEAA